MTDSITAQPLILIASFLLLWAIGVGPALFLISRSPRRLTYAVYTAPAIGFVLTSLALTPIVLAGFTVDTFAAPLAIILVVVSIALVINYWRINHSEIRLNIRRGKFATVVLCGGFVFAALAAPTLIGGDDYRFSQGTTWDAANYMIMSYYAQHFSWQDIDKAATVDKVLTSNPALVAAINRPESLGRYTTFFCAAWLSSVFHYPIYYLYYPFKLLCLLIAFWITLALCDLLAIKSWHRYGISIVMAIGFWAYYVNDIDAVGQINSIPLYLLLLFAWLQVERDAPVQWLSRQRLLLGGVFAALILTYIESVPLFLVSVTLYYAISLIRHKIVWRVILTHVSTLLITAILILPTMVDYIRYLSAQYVVLANTDRNAMALYYYPWLFNAQMLGKELWGLHFQEGLGGAAFSTLLTNALGFALTVSLVIGIVTSLVRRTIKPEIRLLACCAAVYWGGGFGFFILNKSWQSGKILSMGYPFVVLFLCLLADTAIRVKGPSAGGNPKPTSLAVAVYLLLTLWIALQATIPAIRIRSIVDDKGQFPDYVRLKEVGLSDLLPILDYEQQNPGHLVGTDFRDRGIFQPPLWTLMLADQQHQVSLQGMEQIYNQPPVAWQTSRTLPDQMLLTTQSDYLAGSRARVLLTNATLTLYAVSPTDIDRALLDTDLMRSDNRYAVVTDNLDAPVTLDNRPVRWFVGAQIPQQGTYYSGDQGRLRFLASGTQKLAVTLTIVPQYTGFLSLSFNAHDVQRVAVTPGIQQTLTLCLNPQTGTNDLVLDYQVAPNTPPADVNEFGFSRRLLLRAASFQASCQFTF